MRKALPCLMGLVAGLAAAALVYTVTLRQYDKDAAGYAADRKARGRVESTLPEFLPYVGPAVAKPDPARPGYLAAAAAVGVGLVVAGVSVFAFRKANQAPAARK